MNIPPQIFECLLAALLAGVMALQSWVLVEIVGLKASVAVLMDEHNRRKAK